VHSLCQQGGQTTTSWFSRTAPRRGTKVTSCHPAGSPEEVGSLPERRLADRKKRLRNEIRAAGGQRLARRLRPSVVFGPRNEESKDGHRKGGIENLKGENALWFLRKPRAAHPDRETWTSLSRKGGGEPDCRKTVLRGGAEQLDPTQTWLRSQGRTVRNSPGGPATERKRRWSRSFGEGVPLPKAIEEKAWRIRIGTTTRKWQHRRVGRCGFLFLRQFC